MPKISALIVLTSLALLAVVALLFTIANPTAAQTSTPTPTVSTATANITVRDGATPGEVIVAFDAVPAATHYRIGYVNMVSDYPLAKASRASNWINAFIYADENACNLAIRNGRVEYTVRRLEPGANHAFTVLAGNEFMDTGAAGYVQSKFHWARERWTFHTVAENGTATVTPEVPATYPDCNVAQARPTPTPTPAPINTPVPTATPHEENICPITGLPIPEGGYLSVGDTLSTLSGRLTYRLDSATMPSSVPLVGGEDYTAPSGRKLLDLCGTRSNLVGVDWYFQPGTHHNLATDTGIGFAKVDGWDDFLPSNSTESGCTTWTVPKSATTAIYAINLTVPGGSTLYSIDLTNLSE